MMVKTMMHQMVALLAALTTFSAAVVLARSATTAQVPARRR